MVRVLCCSGETFRSGAAHGDPWAELLLFFVIARFFPGIRLKKYRMWSIIVGVCKTRATGAQQ